MAKMTWRNYREESRMAFGGEHEEGFRPCDQKIGVGALARIADAVELMAKRYQDLLDERDRYKQYLANEQRWRNECKRSNAALRGQITKLKKRLGEA